MPEAKGVRGSWGNMLSMQCSVLFLDPPWRSQGIFQAVLEAWWAQEFRCICHRHFIKHCPVPLANCFKPLSLSSWASPWASWGYGPWLPILCEILSVSPRAHFTSADWLSSASSPEAWPSQGRSPSPGHFPQRKIQDNVPHLRILNHFFQIRTHSWLPQLRPNIFGGHYSPPTPPPYLFWSCTGIKMS